MQGMNALLPGEHDWLNGNTPSGSPMTPEPPKNRGGIMNALGAVFKYGAPEAYEQGRQRKATETMGNALAMGNYEDAAQTAFQSGNLDQGMQLRQYAQGQQAAGSEQEAAMRQQQAEGTLSLFSQMQPEQVTEFAMSQPTEFERITGMTSDEYMQAGAQMRQSGRDPAEFHQFVVQKAKAELGQMPERVEGKVVNNRLVNPYTAEEMGNYSDPEGPMSTMGKLAADLNAGRITQEQYDLEVARMSKPSSQVTVNTGNASEGQRPIVDKPSKDYQRVWDEEAGTYRDMPIPGGAAARDEEALNSKAYQAYRADEEQMAAIMTNIDSAEELISGWTAGAGSLLANVPATPARDLQARMETVRANIGFDKLNEMRQTSPTGGALGQVTERELNFLQSVRGSLDAGQSPDQLKETLREIKASLQRLQEVRQIAFQMHYAEPGQERPQIRADERPTNSDLPPGFEIVE